MFELHLNWPYHRLDSSSSEGLLRRNWAIKLLPATDRRLRRRPRRSLHRRRVRRRRRRRVVERRQRGLVDGGRAGVGRAAGGNGDQRRLERIMIRQSVVEIILKFGLGGCGGSGGTWRSGCLRRQGFDSHKISIKLFLTKKMIKRPGIYENVEMRRCGKTG